MIRRMNANGTMRATSVIVDAGANSAQLEIKIGFQPILGQCTIFKICLTRD